jgi:predicted Zn-dependent protease
MLFDLRGRGRRRTVQGVYLGLAVLMGGGLVLFGVGAGNGIGGLLNAFTGSGSGSAQSQAVSQAEKTALKQTQQDPNNAAAWGNLLQARWTSAGQGSDFNSTAGTFTAAGQKELQGAVDAWQRYLALEKNPDPNLAVLAARAYAGLGQWGNEANAWEVVTLGTPNDTHGYECLAVSAYGAGQTRKGDLAAAKALSLLSKTQQASVKPALTEAKSSASTAQQLAAQC